MRTSKYGVKCYLVGAGPGAIDLLTLRALEVLQQADAVIYDRLTSREMLDFAPKGAERIYIGQYHWKANEPYNLQESTESGESKQKSLDLLIRVCQHFDKQSNKQSEEQSDEASQSLKPSKISKFLNPYKVVRLKGGDPFVFGRAQEEMNALLSKDIPFEVIPGIASFHAAAAASSIPLTLLEKGRSFSVLTGHFSKEDEQDKRKVIATSDTVVYLMGVKNLARLVSENLKVGKAPSTPIAMIENVSLPEQRIRVSTLGSVLAEHERIPIRHPAVLIIGETVHLHKRFYEITQRPLAGVKIGFLRTADELKKLKNEIENWGGVPVSIPLIEHQVLDGAEKDLLAALSGQTFRTLLLTSKRAVERLFEILMSCGQDLRILCGLTLVAIGEGTAKSLVKYGLQADIIAERASQEGMRDVIVQQKLNDILLPQSKEARPWLINWMQTEGYRYKRMVLYSTAVKVSKQHPQKKLVKMFRTCEVIMVTSDSALQALRIFIELNLSAFSQIQVNSTKQEPHEYNKFLPTLVTISQALQQKSREELGKFLSISAEAASYRSMVETAAKLRTDKI